MSRAPGIRPQPGMRYEMPNLFSHLGSQPGGLAMTTHDLVIIVFAGGVHDCADIFCGDLLLAVDGVESINFLFDVGSVIVSAP